ncbi:lipase 1 precursor [Ophiostoma piceae UAMH 11346]|uniref:Lipase 1 n=1 Tax=Ophiostoma piceae (strain UAMH 11346) TaxID=1262450 RepID=S3C1J8_OPHP1|nr:lipase 1 precursor [Ophiostoma piceae UAMH 11346]
MRTALLLVACLNAPAAVLAYGDRKLVQPNLAILATAASSTTSNSSSCSSALLYEPVAPSEDPWYTAPYEFENEKPGTILRVRPAPGNLTLLAGNASAAYNILYRTTNSLYKPTWAVTTLFIPKKASSASNSSTTNGALLSYQIAYDSNYINASPSYALYSSLDQDISTALGKGYYVSVPDYEGPLASFTAGVLSGHATLDSLRAILSTAGKPRFGLPANNSIALWGYSGGALASEWAAELQVQYAPELNISGIAVGGLTPNVTSVLFSINGGVGAGIAPPAILGITNQFPDVYEYVLSLLKSEGTNNKTGFLAAQNYTLNQDIGAFLGKNISDYFEGGLSAVLSPLAQKVIHSDGIMGYHGIPQVPIYAYKAIKDELSPVNDTDTLVARYCAVGANILYERSSIGGHTSGAINGRASATAFVDAIFGGTYAATYNTTGCTIREVAWNESSLSF